LPIAISWWTASHQFQTCSCSGPVTQPSTRPSSCVQTNSAMPVLAFVTQNTRPAASVTPTFPAAICAIV
jgi:hypothetical protein